MNEVLKFIEDMCAGHKEAMVEIFAHGYCYWFAVILSERFCGEIYYLEIENHWITKIEDKFYDVTGEVNGEGSEPWKDFVFKDELLTKRLYRDCILKI
jgi:hypothetical protein